MQANWIVLSTPRTGSTFISELAFLYLQRKHGYTANLHEFLNPYHYNLFYQDDPEQGVRRNLQEWAPDAFRAVYSLDTERRIAASKSCSPEKTEPETESRYRIGLLNETPHRYMLHVHAAPLHAPALEYVLARTQPILTARRDRWEQVLSYGVAYGTKIFRTTRQSQIPEITDGSLTFPEGVFKDLCSRIRRFQEVAQSWPNAPKVYYEDFCSLKNPLEILNEIGWSDWPEYIRSSDLDVLPTRSFPGNKERYFSNLSDMQRWFAEAAL